MKGNLSYWTEMKMWHPTTTMTMLDHEQRENLTCLPCFTDDTKSLNSICRWAKYQTEIVNFLYVSCLYTNEHISKKTKKLITYFSVKWRFYHFLYMLKLILLKQSKSVIYHKIGFKISICIWATNIINIFSCQLSRLSFN